MAKELYRYQFTPQTPVEEIESTLVLAIEAAEALHGETQVRLDAAHYLDVDRRACIVDARTSVGRDFNRLFLGFLRRQVGDDGFEVSRVESPLVKEGAT